MFCGCQAHKQYTMLEVELLQPAPPYQTRSNDGVDDSIRDSILTSWSKEEPPMKTDCDRSKWSCGKFGKQG